LKLSNHDLNHSHELLRLVLCATRPRWRAMTLVLLAPFYAACAQPPTLRQSDIESAQAAGVCVVDVVNRHVAIFRLDGSRRSLTVPMQERSLEDSDGRMSPDGTYVVFVRDVVGESGVDALSGVALDGRILWEVYGRGIYPPEISADGRKLAFVEVNQLTTYDVASKRKASLGVPGQRPSWAPDGNLLAYDDGSTVFTIDVATGSRSTIGSGTEPWWTADGSAVAVQRKSGKIDLIDLHSRSRREFLSGSYVRVPRWSSNGEWFVYTRAGGEPWWSLRNASEPHQIVVRNAQSGAESAVGVFYKANPGHFTWVTNRTVCQG
jgi:Tol biopolymer transport system component